MLIHPGLTIKDELDIRNITIEEFATQMDMELKQAKLLLIGRITLTEETAIKLEKLLKIDKRFWLELEKNKRMYEE